ncbi:hypothetical protein D3C78_1714480 [compost metagenome]
MGNHAGIPDMGNPQFLNTFQCFYINVIKLTTPILFNDAISNIFSLFVTEQPRQQLINYRFVLRLTNGRVCNSSQYNQNKDS